MKYHVQLDEQEFEFDVTVAGQAGRPVVHRDAEDLGIDFDGHEPLGPYSLLLNGVSHEGYVEFVEGEYRVLLDGHVFRVGVEESSRFRIQSVVGGGQHRAGAANIAAPMPGLVIGIQVEVGQAVKRGETVVILQAMKMENELRTPRDGIIKEIQTHVGDTVAQGQVLVTLE